MMKAIVKTDNTITIQEKNIPWVDNESLLIKVSLAGLCRTDCYVAQDKIAVKNGITLGHEFTGIVEKVGQGVNGFHQQQRVGVMPVITKNDDFSMLGVEIDGAYADFITVPASNVYLIPDNLGEKEAAFLEPIAACLSVVNAPIQRTQRGLVYGNNRIAELTTRILEIKGFNNIDVLTNVHLSELTNEYDFIIETTPTEDAFENMARLVKPKGMILLKSRPYHAVPLPIHAIVRKEIKLTGVYYGDFKESIELLATGCLSVADLFGATYSFAEAIPILLGQQKTAEDKKIFFKP